MASEQVNLRIPKELLDKIDRAATAAFRTRTNFILKVLKETVEKKERR